VVRRSARGARREAGALEREVLAALSAADGPMTPADVQAGLGTNLAYTTVMTTLSRLHDKGVLDRERRGRAYAYSPVGDGAAVRARQMRQLLDVDADRAGVLAHFVAELGPEDEQLLAALLDDEPS
jgi:predicted transcriptional regulator